MTVKSTTELRPWSYRQNALVKSLITIAAGVASAFVGTFAHRMGAELNIPYGLVLAFLLIGLSTWCARSRMGAVGLKSAFPHATHNPIPWINAWLSSDNVQVAPQEVEVSSYLVGQISTDMSTQDLSAFEL